MSAEDGGFSGSLNRMLRDAAAADETRQQPYAVGPQAAAEQLRLAEERQQIKRLRLAVHAGAKVIAAEFASALTERGVQPTAHLWNGNPRDVYSDPAIPQRRIHKEYHRRREAIEAAAQPAWIVKVDQTYSFGSQPIFHGDEAPYQVVSYAGLAIDPMGKVLKWKGERDANFARALDWAPIISDQKTERDVLRHQRLTDHQLIKIGEAGTGDIIPFGKIKEGGTVEMLAMGRSEDLAQFDLAGLPEYMPNVSEQPALKDWQSHLMQLAFQLIRNNPSDIEPR